MFVNMQGIVDVYLNLGEVVVLILLFVGIFKFFLGVKVFSEVFLEFFLGEVIVLVGENGVGKLIIVKILIGIYQFDEGEIKIQGSFMIFLMVQDVGWVGVMVIYQEIVFFDDFLVVENIFIGYVLKMKFGLIDCKVMIGQVQVFLDCIGVKIDLIVMFKDFGIVNKYLVVIV